MKKHATGKRGAPQSKSRQRPRSRTDWQRLDTMTDEKAHAAALADPDAQPLDDEWFARADLIVPRPPKQSVTLRIDRDVLAFFRAGGQGYQSRMNAVLRAFKERRAG